MEQLRRQITALTDTVHCLLPPCIRSKEEHKWENNIKTEILEFQGSINLGEFIYWLNTIKRVFDYYEVSEESWLYKGAY